MNFEDFELLAKKHLEKLLRNDLRGKVKIEHRKMFVSAAGNRYEVDLSYDFEIGNARYLTLVECKQWNSNVTREKIGHFKSVLDELKANKGIVITTKGFQKGAIEFAKTNGIGLIKISNDDQFKVISHFVGDIEVLESHLLKVEVFSPKSKTYCNGLFYTSDIFDFVEKRYGNEIAAFLRSENESPSVSVVSKLSELGYNWNLEYEIIESAGLHVKMSNEVQMRILNMKVIMVNVGRY
ncbi:restriction endonuclease [Fulvivirga sp. RKSG066]|uniref:restriction endonuclease n=1 Tax=Fulvivirga aurantia TaxID=2529383 RepID=UPI0012BD5993|nr:restriction endonuclease [Fulvivirga aurantia]MTI19692.1 restriction endonuclease [Fulvivirga aurantia]